MSIREAEVLAALPPADRWITRYVQYGRDCSDANIAYHLGVGLTLMSIAAPVNYELPFGQPLHANLFLLLVGPSRTARKTRAITLGRRILQAALPQRVGEEPGSPQGLEESVIANPQQVIFFEEFGSFLAKAAEGYMMPIKTTFNLLYDVAPIGRALAKTRGRVQANPRVSVIGGCAPGYLERHSEAVDWTEGFFSRFLTFSGSRERTYTYPPGSPDSGRLVQDLKAMAERKYGKCLGLAEDAKKMWDTFYLSLEGQAESSARATAGAAAGAHTNTLKIALILALEKEALQPYWYVTPELLDTAIKITRLHLKSVYTLGDSLADNRDMRDRRTILNLLSASAPMTMDKLIFESKLLMRRVTEIVDSLGGENAIIRNADGSLLRSLRPGEIDVKAESAAVTRRVVLSVNVTTDAERAYQNDVSLGIVDPAAKLEQVGAAVGSVAIGIQSSSLLPSSGTKRNGVNGNGSSGKGEAPSPEVLAPVPPLPVAPGIVPPLKLEFESFAESSAVPSEGSSSLSTLPALKLDFD